MEDGIQPTSAAELSKTVYSLVLMLTVLGFRNLTYTLGLLRSALRIGNWVGRGASLRPRMTEEEVPLMITYLNKTGKLRQRENFFKICKC